MKRRLYAVETWIAMTGLAVYVAVTEILPRKARKWLRDGRRAGLGIALTPLPGPDTPAEAEEKAR